LRPVAALPAAKGFENGAIAAGGLSGATGCRHFVEDLLDGDAVLGERGAGVGPGVVAHLVGERVGAALVE